MAHAHPHVPHELTEGKEAGKPTSHGERVLELGAVLLLSMTAVATAWSGYQAARWSGEQSKGYAQASTARIHSQRQASHAGQVRIDDLLYFNGWLNAHSTGHQALGSIYERRFRPGFVPAFRAWIAQRPFTDPNAIPGRSTRPSTTCLRSTVRMPSTTRRTASTKREPTRRPTTTTTSSPRSSSPQCSSSPASRCASTGGRCESPCSCLRA